jgi:hypothetical protein
VATTNLLVVNAYIINWSDSVGFVKSTIPNFWELRLVWVEDGADSPAAS